MKRNSYRAVEKGEKGYERVYGGCALIYEVILVEGWHLDMLESGDLTQLTTKKAWKHVFVFPLNSGEKQVQIEQESYLFDFNLNSVVCTQARKFSQRSWNSLTNLRCQFNAISLTYRSLKLRGVEKVFFLFWILQSRVLWCSFSAVACFIYSKEQHSYNQPSNHPEWLMASIAKVCLKDQPNCIAS